MKKFLVVVLSLILALGWTLPCLAEDEQSYFISELVHGMGYSKDTWLSTSLNRAMLTVFLMVETVVDQNANAKTGITDFDSVTGLVNSYVGLAGDDLFVLMASDTGAIAWIYDPDASGLVGVSKTATTKAQADYIMNAMCTKYYANDVSDLATIMEMVSNAIK